MPQGIRLHRRLACRTRRCTVRAAAAVRVSVRAAAARARRVRGFVRFTRALDHPNVASAFVRPLVEPAAVGGLPSRPTGNARVAPRAPARVVVLGLWRRVAARSQQRSSEVRSVRVVAGGADRSCSHAGVGAGGRSWWPDPRVAFLETGELRGMLLAACVAAPRSGLNADTDLGRGPTSSPRAVALRSPALSLMAASAGAEC